MYYTASDLRYSSMMSDLHSILNDLCSVSRRAPQAILGTTAFLSGFELIRRLAKFTFEGGTKEKPRFSTTQVALVCGGSLFFGGIFTYITVPDRSVVGADEFPNLLEAARSMGRSLISEGYETAHKLYWGWRPLPTGKGPKVF